MTSKIKIEPSPSAEHYRAEDDQGDVFTSDDPWDLFAQWFDLAAAHEINDTNAMALATVDAAGMPDCRIVLLKELSDRGFVFFSNYDSAKGMQTAQRPVAALCFHWKSIRRQVRVRGMVERLDEAESDAYFATRARDAQIGAWASEQSREMATPADLQDRIAQMKQRFEGADVPRPPHWGGSVVVPQTIEFWVNRPFRLHDRLLFTRTKNGWDSGRLYP